MAKRAGAIRAGRAFVEMFLDDGKLVRGLRMAQARLKAWGASVQQMGRQMLKASTMMSAPFVISSVVFARFEQSMARVRALTNANGDAFAKLEGEAKRLGETTVFTASQAAEAMSFFALAGFDVEQILKAIGPTLSLAAAGQLEMAESADIVAKIMAGMGVEADRVGEAVDVLTKAFTTANTDLRQLGDAMKFVGPIAKTAGLGFTEVVAAIQMLSNAGIQGEMAGTTLRTGLLSLTSPSKEAAETLRKLGVSVSDAEGNVRPLADIVQQLESALSGMGSGERLEALGTIFNARQAAGFAELINQGAESMRELTHALDGADGTAARIAGIQLNTLNGQIIMLKSALEGLAISIGSALNAPLRVAADLIRQVTVSVSEWVKANQLVVAGAAAAIAVIGGMGAALLMTGIAAKVAAFAVGGLVSILALAKVAIGAIATVFGLLLSPIGLAIAGVVALGGYILYATGAGGAALEWLGSKFSALGKIAGDTFEGIRDALAGGDIALAAKVMWAGLHHAWLEGIKPLRDMWNEFRFVFESTAVNAFSAVKGAWIEVRDWFYDNFPNFTATIAKVWASLSATIRTVWAKTVNWVADQILEIMGMLDDTLDVKGAQALGKRELDKKLVEIENDKTAAMVEADRKKELTPEQREAERNVALAEIEDARLKALEKLGEAHNKRVQDAADALQAARDELERLRKEAKEARESADSGDGPASPGRFRGMLDEFEGLVAAAVEGANERIQTQGTFSAAAVAGLGGGDAAERTANATEETAKNTSRIARMRATFS